MPEHCSTISCSTCGKSRSSASVTVRGYSNWPTNAIGHGLSAGIERLGPIRSLIVPHEQILDRRDDVLGQQVEGRFHFGRVGLVND